MILLECTNCRETLEVDDAFAGGVCRCRHCGTIQTVPADAPRVDVTLAGGKDAPPPVVGGSKSLYRREEQRGGYSSGLDELADIVASSGTLSSGLHRTIRGNKGKKRGRKHRSRRRSQESERHRTDRRLIVAVAVAAVLAVVAALLALALFTGGFGFLTGSGSSAPETQSALLTTPVAANCRNLDECGYVLYNIMRTGRVLG